MKFMPILAKGEKLAEEITKGRGPADKTFPYTYDEAKKRTIRDVNEVTKEIDNNKELYLENEIIINIRMAETFIAKSYMPDFFNKKESMEFVGARVYNKRMDKNKEIKSKLYFVKCSKEHLDWFLNDLENDNFTKTQEKQLRSIEKIDILGSKEKALGFDEEEGLNEKQLHEVEIILHPIRHDKNKAISKLKNFLNGDISIREYEDGPTFILAKIKKENIDNIAKYNFLRTIHPMREIKLPEMKSFDGTKLPNLSNITNKSSKIKIGVFDGGANEENPYLKPYIKNYDISSMPATLKGLQHGSAVSGIILYGEINEYKSTETLKEPKCLVESFRVLPEKDMYKIIDNIENIVSARDDIGIYNISFGPRGPILDDQIDRFTYALDKLALKNKMFCIAVGNDGNVAEPFNRIQAPSDAVNCIGVGAYSKYNNEIYRAGYSCIGSGREGAKLKPDLLAFGGDERNLFQTINLDGSKRWMTAGTSFAAPIVAKKLGELSVMSQEIDLLMARTMLIHSAKKTLKSAIEEGFGIVEEDVKNIIECNESKVTVLYEGYIIPSRCIKLPIPLPDMKNQIGKIKFSWTICTLTDVSTLDSDLYTNSCIEETFYPNSDIYNFTKDGEKSVKVNISKEQGKVAKLLLMGYTQSRNPVGDTAKRKSEHERRLDYKWDTISTKSKGKEMDSVKDPFLIISALSRDDSDVNKVKFSIAVTVEIKKYQGNMYEDILNKYDVLTPIQLEQEVEQEVEQ